jgi:hypothetical protein
VPAPHPWPTTRATPSSTRFVADEIRPDLHGHHVAGRERDRDGPRKILLAVDEPGLPGRVAHRYARAHVRVEPRAQSVARTFAFRDQPHVGRECGDSIAL